MSGGCDTVHAGWEDAVHHRKDIPDSILCCQQDRDTLPGAQVVKQKEGNRPELNHLEASIFGRIS